MMIVLSPTYTLRIEIQDKMRCQTAPNMTATQLQGLAFAGTNVHKWFNGAMGKTGCDEVIATVKKALADAGIADANVWLEKFEHRA